MFKFEYQIFTYAYEKYNFFLFWYSPNIVLHNVIVITKHT